MPESINIAGQAYWLPKTWPAGLTDRTGTPEFLGDIGENGVKRNTEYEVIEQMASRLGVSVRTAVIPVGFKMDMTIHLSQMNRFAWAAIFGTTPKTGGGANATHGIGDAPGQYGWIKIQSYDHAQSLRVIEEHFALMTIDESEFHRKKFADVTLKFAVIGATNAAAVVNTMQ